MPLLDHPNVASTMNDEDEHAAPLYLDPTDELIRQKIVHSLSVYPGISMTMLQISIGTSIAPNLWKPTYLKMVQAKIILETVETKEGPGGRIIMYKHINLAKE